MLHLSCSTGDICVLVALTQVWDKSRYPSSSIFARVVRLSEDLAVYILFAVGIFALYLVCFTMAAVIDLTGHIVFSFLMGGLSILVRWRKLSTRTMLVAFAIFNFLTGLCYYLVAFDGKHTVNPGCTGLFGR